MEIKNKLKNQAFNLIFIKCISWSLTQIKYIFHDLLGAFHSPHARW